MELLFWKQAAGGAAFLLTFLLFVPYIRGIRRRETVPHVFSWIVWAFGTLVVFFAQLAGGAGLGAWPIGFSACLTAYVAWLAFQVRGRIEITRHDWVLFVLALIALPAWAFAADPFWAVLALTVADLLGFGPTLRKAYRQPHEEHAGFFAVGALRNLLVIAALEQYSWITALFPAAVGAACLVVALFVLSRRAMLSAAA